MDIIAQIELFKTLFYVCMAVAILGFALAVFFFFYFRIPDVRALMTGKAREETIRRINEKNAQTGSLRTISHGFSDDLRTSGNLKDGHSGNIRHSSKLKKGHSGDIRGSGKLKKSHEEPVSRVYTPAEEAPTIATAQAVYETAVLQTGAPETSVLQGSETAILGSKSAQPQPVAVPTPVPANVYFVVTENTLVIHTDEII